MWAHRLSFHMCLGRVPLFTWLVRVDLVGAFLESPKDSETNGQDPGTRSVEWPPPSTLCKGLGGMAICKLWDGPGLANTREFHSNPGSEIQGHFVLWDKDLGPLSRWMDTARAEEGQAGGGCCSQRRGPEGEMALLWPRVPGPPGCFPW